MSAVIAEEKVRACQLLKGSALRNARELIYLSGPGASGSRQLPGGNAQRPGGSNRVVLQVRDLPALIEAMRGAGVSFRNAMETGPGGKQIQVLDPDGNPVELFEPA
jgi:glyoxylase I family protein